MTTQIQRKNLAPSYNRVLYKKYFPSVRPKPANFKFINFPQQPKTIRISNSLIDLVIIEGINSSAEFFFCA